MNGRINVPSGTQWEDVVGYSRAVRVGQIVEVAGTTAVDEQGRVIGVNDPYAQARYALAKIETALAAAGARLEDVVRTRIYVTDIGRWQEIGRAHGEVFAAIRPVTSMVQIAALINPDLLVEIEATAMISHID
jgi:enamine deaminase RidA (YjgF/YER057c/UK114 family)